MSLASQRVLLHGGSVYSPVHPSATAMLTVGDTVVWVGDDTGARAHVDHADVVIKLQGRLVTPGFVDAHVHLSKTGFALQAAELGSAKTLGEALDLLAAQAAADDSAVLFAHGWDETHWPEARPFTGLELDGAVGTRAAYVSRVDGHSGVVSSALVEQDRAMVELDGWRGDGVVERDAHHAARNIVDALRTIEDRERALLLALRQAARVGITSVHEINAPHIAPYDDADVIARLRSQHPLPEVVGYWGALLGGDQADETAVAGFAGDLCVDGALGSRTAALGSPYSDADSTGHLYLDDAQIRDHVVFCTERGVQAGFHVIGDRGLEAVTSGLRQAGEKVGVEAIVAARHRLEHVEMPAPTDLAAIAELGVVASVQPAFDAAWGAPGELYEQRLGPNRAGPMNPFASMQRAGIVLAFGSDSPVTPMDPWGAVRAAVLHHNLDERLSQRAAFTAHTQGGHRARRDDVAGTLVAGATASYAVWDVEALTTEGLPDLTAVDAGMPGCVRTVVAGVVAFDSEALA
jgi:predicted amidohydrolase YtcJ